MAKPANLFERHSRKTLAIVCSLPIFAVLALDCANSHLKYQRTRDFLIYETLEGVGHYPKPDQVFTWSDDYHGEYHVVVRTNNLGFRGPDPYDPIENREKRVIFALGDSTTAAYEADYEYTYPHVLGRILDGRAVVYNAAVRGYDTHNVVQLYRRRIAALKPSVVIYMVCFNDFLSNRERRGSLLDYTDVFGRGYLAPERGFAEVWIPPLEGVDLLPYRVQLFASTHFRFLYHRVYGAVKRLAGASAVAAPPRAERLALEPEDLELMKALLRILATEVASSGAKLYVTWFPTKWPDALAEAKLEAEGLSDAAKQSRREYFELSNRAQDAIRDFVESELEGASFIRTNEYVFGRYERDPDLPDFSYHHDGHASNFGSTLLGIYIASQIVADEKTTELRAALEPRPWLDPPAERARVE